MRQIDKSKYAVCVIVQRIVQNGRNAPIFVGEPLGRMVVKTTESEDEAVVDMKNVCSPNMIISSKDGKIDVSCNHPDYRVIRI